MHCMRAHTHMHAYSQYTHVLTIHTRALVYRLTHNTHFYTHMHPHLATWVIDNSLFAYMCVKLLYHITSSNADPNGTYQTKEWLERVLIIGITKLPSSITISSGILIITRHYVLSVFLLDKGKQDLRFKYNSSKKVLEIKKPGLNISKDFSITLSYVGRI